MVNVWMPIKKITAYPLAVLDTESINFEKYIIPNMTKIKGIADEFQSGALRYKKWYTILLQSQLEPGEVIIFDSFKTSHTAFIMPGQTDDRESYDLRCAFIKRL